MRLTYAFRVCRVRHSVAACVPVGDPSHSFKRLAEELALLQCEVCMMDVARMHGLVEGPLLILRNRDPSRRLEEAHARAIGVSRASLQCLEIPGDPGELTTDAGRPMRRNDGAGGQRGKTAQSLYPCAQRAIPGVGNAPETREPSGKKDARLRIPDGDASRSCGAVLVDEVEPATGHGNGLRAPEHAVGPRHAGTGHERLAQGCATLREATLAALSHDARGRLVGEDRRTAVRERGGAE